VAAILIPLLVKARSQPQWRCDNKSFDFCLQTIKELEKEILRGQSFQGPLVAQEIHEVLKERGIVDE
jgi:hypothetical protein